MISFLMLIKDLFLHHSFGSLALSCHLLLPLFSTSKLDPCLTLHLISYIILLYINT
jgi:hypothetical protein